MTSEAHDIASHEVTSNARTPDNHPTQRENGFIAGERSSREVDHDNLLSYEIPRRD